MQNPISLIRKRFEDIPVSPEWGFGNVKSTQRWTHGYHRYPAKFLPNLVEKLIEDYTTPNDVVADLFAGCGTTLVEAKIHGRKSVGVDINPVAELITKAKIQPIDPKKLSERFQALQLRLEKYDSENYKKVIVHERLDYWFDETNKLKIAFLYERILLLRDENIKLFFLVALSNILKNCSRWLQTSTKPQVDPKKIPSDPFIAFKNQAKQMIKKNEEFYQELSKLNFINTKCEIRLEDARSTGVATKNWTKY